ncbi:MAG: HDOD domain-containing protein [Myxococcales bacterium]|nr:HDOD domain-containing protein [Myxococcales bacterium]
MSAVSIDSVELPPFPDVAAAVLRAANDPDEGVDRVASLVQRDPALATTVMSVANSAAFAGRVPAVTLTHAIGRLGLRTMADLTVTACLRPRETSTAHAEQLAAVWTHAVATAGFAREISLVRRRQVESVFLCGLLHSIGAMVLLEVDQIEQLDERYVETGVQVTMAWGMPAAVVAAVGMHRDWPTAETWAEEACTTWLARLLAQEMLDMPVDVGSIEEDAVLDELDIYPGDLDKLRASADDIRAMLTVLA